MASKHHRRWSSSMSTLVGDEPNEKPAETFKVNSVSSPSASTASQRTPLPWKQLAILGYLRLGESVSFFVIFPFIPRLVIDFGIADSDKTAGYLAGVVESLFSFTQFLTVFHWSRLSDRIGRKPVLLCGLVGLTASMTIFGLSKSFTGIIISRMVAGAFSANGGVLQSMIGELTDPTNQAQAFTLMPLMSGIGGSLGPFLGGYLAHPAENFKTFDTPFHRANPYFLPCAVSAFIPLTSLFVCFFFAQETLTLNRTEDYQMVASSPTATAEFETDQEDPEANQPFSASDNSLRPVKDLLTPQVKLVLLSYGLVALNAPAFLGLFPLFCFARVSAGGLGLSQSAIGNTLAFRGVAIIAVQLFLFARINNRFGSAKTLRLVSLCYGFQFALFPVATYFARREASWAVFILLEMMMILWASGNMAWSTCTLLITGHAPSKRDLASLNGLMEAIASLTKTIAPTLSNNLFALSVDKGWMNGNLYWIAFLGLSASLSLSAYFVKDSFAEWRSKPCIALSEDPVTQEESINCKAVLDAVDAEEQHNQR